MRIRHLLPIAVVAFGLGIFSLAGCGGGGGGSSSMGIFVTDGFGDQFSQVWVTLYRIEASTDGTTFQTLFDDTNGKVINVATLVNSAEFLGAVTAPSSGFTKVRIIIGDHLTLVPKAGGATLSVPVDDIFPTANGKSTIVFDVTAPASHHDVIVDFDLAAFEMIGGKVRPHVKHGDDNAFHNSEKHAELEGVVSNLTSAGFDMTLGAATIKVQVNTSTTVFSELTGAAATLANGQKVDVKGSVDPDTHIVLATAIKVEDVDAHGGGNGHHHDGAGIEGTVASVNAADTSFVVTLKGCEHFHPSAGTVTVKTDLTTVFEKQHVDHATFADVTANAKVEAAGAYDDTTNTLTAKRVEIH